MKMKGWRMSLFFFVVLVSIMLASCSDSNEAPVAQPTAVSPTESPSTEGVQEESSVEPTAVSIPTTEATTEPIPEPMEDPIHLAIIWHQHQPIYFKDPETNSYVRPWVRMHAVKDYVDMVTILEDYPDVHVTFNVTPSLIQQLDDFAAGAKDDYWLHTETPADQLSDEQKQFILDRFFDTNRKIVTRFPRYAELLDKRDNSADALNEYTIEDYRDLQLLFNLAWTDPDFLAQEPLAALVAKGSNFDEADKAIVLGEHLRLIEATVPILKAAQDAGQIEVTMTPYAHPILPLLVNTDLARVALPDIELPAQRFVYGQDAVAQVERGVQLYTEKFGQPPRGMWPAEGSVAQEIVTMVAQNGLEWMATDEGVLAKSLGMDSFTRNAADIVIEADTLYRPYTVEGSRGGPVAIVFRDVVISDKVGFTYSGMSGEAAAEDFVAHIRAIRTQLEESGAEGPHLVSVILDGENAWEHYDNDGKEFLHTLYQMLNDDPLITTVTPSEFLEIAPDQPTIDELWAGSWINADFSTWIGEEEENRAWELLTQTRDFLQPYLSGSHSDAVTPEQIETAVTYMFAAEGSDWFWWYGSDQESGNDSAFDRQYRETLKQVYLALEQEPPAILDVPIIPEQAASADRAATDLITPTIDGVTDEGEWDAAGYYSASGGVMATGVPYFDGIDYGFDKDYLYLRPTSSLDFEVPPATSSVQIYLGAPGSGDVNNFSQGGTLLGFPANRMVEISFENGALTTAAFYAADGDSWTAVQNSNSSGEQVILENDDNPPGLVAVGDGVVETAVPLTALGNIDEGSQITFRAIYTETEDDVDQVPGLGTAVVNVPDLGTTTVLIDIADPENDDYGPGSYIYPGDSVFNSGNFDITQFQVGYDEEDIVFKLWLRGPVDNLWDSGNGLSLQTLDTYIDIDGDQNGGTAMLPGRNLSFSDEYRWDYAITAEGWTSGVYVPAEGDVSEIAGASEFQILTDPGQRKVTIRVPKAILGDDPENWHFAAGVMSQEGFPSGGVMRIRDVVPEAEQWRIGGAPVGATNHTRILDLVWPEAGEQETWLSAFTPSNITQTQLSPADFAQISMFGTE